jgi:hypothetical protein
MPEILRAPGQAVDAATKRPLAPWFGYEFSHIRAHSDAEASESAVATPAPAVNEVPPIVHEVLRSPGQPLDPATRASLEPRLGHDFADVRIHTDAKAAESARTVHALAYTFGRDVVFGAGQYALHSSEGRKLMAHELAHVAQGGGQGIGIPRTISSPDSPAERDATIVAESIATDRSFRPAMSVKAAAMVRRQPGPRRPAGPDRSNESKAPAVWQPVSASDIARIAALLGMPVQFGPGTGGATPRFVIHDTGVTVGEAWIKRQVAEAHAQHGAGAAAYVPRSGPPRIARPSFFDARRPATTQFERVNDLMDKRTREATYRAIWQNSSVTVQTASLAAAVRSGLTPSEQAHETRTAQLELNATSGDVHTTAAWTATEICDIVRAKGAPAAASSPLAAVPLQAACIRLAPVIEARRERIGSTANIETAQDTGSTTRGRGPALPNPAYNESQYDDLVLLYLRAASQAYRWPQITTHLVVDRGVGDHIDPRCFDLMKLYRKIAALMGHPQNTVYGIMPVYGTSQTSTVWWDPVACGVPPP